MCQALANLCVLSLYDQTNAACDFLNDDIGSRIDIIATETNGWREAVPYIQFKESATELLRKTVTADDFKLTTSFTEDPEANQVKYLTFVLGRFHFNGTFLGYTELDSELSLCPMAYEDVLSMREYGT
jgi:hypothetical protein